MRCIIKFPVSSYLIIIFCGLFFLLTPVIIELVHGISKTLEILNELKPTVQPNPKHLSAEQLRIMEDANQERIVWELVFFIILIASFVIFSVISAILFTKNSAIYGRDSAYIAINCVFLVLLFFRIYQKIY